MRQPEHPDVPTVPPVLNDNAVVPAERLVIGALLLVKSQDIIVTCPQLIPIPITITNSVNKTLKRVVFFLGLREVAAFKKFKSSVFFMVLVLYG